MVTVSLEQSAAGNWRVCRCRITLFNDLRLGAANKLAREMAVPCNGSTELLAMRRRAA